MIRPLFRFLPVVGLLTCIVACGDKTPEQQPAATPAPAAPAAAPAPEAKQPEATPQTPSAGEPATIDAGEQVEEPEDQDAPIDQRANTQLAQAIASAHPQAASRWKPDLNYQSIVPAQPTSVDPDKIEVREIFWYGCGHCYALEPFINNWDAHKRPANVQFVRTPVMWSPVHREHAKLYFIIEALGKIQQLHAEVFKEVQDKNNMLVSSDPAQTERMQIAFFKRFGISEEEYRSAAHSMVVDTNLRRAEELTRRYYDGRSGVLEQEGGQRREWGVPLMIVNGKYAADVGSAGGRDELLALVNDLAEREKK